MAKKQTEQSLEEYVAAQEQKDVITSDNMIGKGIISDEVSNPKAFDRYKAAATNEEARALHKADMVETQKDLGMGYILQSSHLPQRPKLI